MGQKGWRDGFVSQGYDTWNKKDAFRTHVGGVNSFHNKEKEKCEFLIREKQAINVVLRRQTEAEDRKYKARLHVYVIVVRLLLKTSLPFCGHDELVNSENKGLYIEVLKAIREASEDIFNNILENAPKNNQLISPKIKKELVQCFAQEVILSICEEIGRDVFGLLVDESSDVSKKEQMAFVLCYVDSFGFVKERFIGLVHVKDTSSLILKNAINEVLTSNKLSFSQQAICEISMVSLERCFSKMKLLKTDLRNKIGDDFLNDALLCNVETEALAKVENEKVIEQFQKMSA
ncbi:uncharacterized protein LOC111904501 [Lactuca sativa]|uniref:uncharacterized protein LOC111904501 n=1 Tax=Lactuca sativa TaxID=4236 RepID=UPI000CD7FF75|nr:uncharacterized protein LOC111904501 [Lactuca sativa]